MKQDCDPDPYLLRYPAGDGRKIRHRHHELPQTPLDDVDYVERESCTNTEFYDKMRAAKGVPSTAAITPIQFCEKYCQYVDEGYTDVIHVPINKSGSSTYNNALMAQGMLREERPEHHLKIHLLDPHTYSMVFGWYLCEMARKLKNGAEISHVIREFEKQMDCMEIVLHLQPDSR